MTRDHAPISAKRNAELSRESTFVEITRRELGSLLDDSATLAELRAATDDELTEKLHELRRLTIAEMDPHLGANQAAALRSQAADAHQWIRALVASLRAEMATFKAADEEASSVLSAGGATGNTATIAG